ncbi:hypothetical protein [Streptomyces sp. UNOC14_S4]|uniref:hypothetical protein n=1 Tax=Streptomyces sp. UNOC14_S4 TaxID=2872340 RepID=UPI001E2E7B67|nr:hypothetical protein [Streptomyces sp. UNOC14_S4]MCC3770064.1 hypothetical protein [Streptomyces sp. UNOC14_S4]
MNTRRLVSTAAVALLAGAGALITAPSASAKAYDLAFDKLTLRSTNNLQAQVTYSCDEGNTYLLVVNATKLNVTGHEESNAAAVLKPAQLTCDYGKHTAKPDLNIDPGSHFAKGDRVRVTVTYFDADLGFYRFKQDTVVTL